MGQPLFRRGPCPRRHLYAYVPLAAHFRPPLAPALGDRRCFLPHLRRHLVHVQQHGCSRRTSSKGPECHVCVYSCDGVDCAVDGVGGGRPGGEGVGGREGGEGIGEW